MQNKNPFQANYIYLCSTSPARTKTGCKTPTAPNDGMINRLVKD